MPRQDQLDYYRGQGSSHYAHWSRRLLNQALRSKVIQKHSQRGARLVGKYVQEKFRGKVNSDESTLHESSQQKKMPKQKSVRRPSYNKIVRNTPINQLANRASMKKKGGKNEKVRSTRKVTVSKSLREKVKKVIAGTEAYGAYYQSYGGAIGMVDPGVSANSQVSLAVGRDGAATSCLWSGPNIPHGNVTWWSGLHYSDSGASGITPLSVGTYMTYFTPLKILNAASVLFNRKALAFDWSLTAGNLSVSTTTATGVGSVGSSQFPQTGGLKVRVINSYVTWRMKNISQRTLYVKVYNCVPKLKFGQVQPLSILSTSGPLTDTAAVYNEFGSTLAAPYTQAGVVCHPCFKPSNYEPWSAAWKASCMTMVINPGEECVHQIQGPKNYTLDYAKLFAQANDEIGSCYKDTTVSCMVSVGVDSVNTNGAVAFTAPSTFRTASVNPLLIDSLDIQVCEVFKVSVPEVAGFITQNGAAGSVEQLNLRKNRKVFANWNDISRAADVYVDLDEENPAATIPRTNLN